MNCGDAEHMQTAPTRRCQKAEANMGPLKS
jgi:hypothetical protein